MKLNKIFQKESSQDEVQYPYLIAEAGVNHEGSMKIARRLIDEAADGGADAIKFQTYKADTLASKDSPAYWDKTKEPTKSQHELFSKYDKFWKKEFEELKEYCEKKKIEFLSTPFDEASAIFLNDLMPAFKISSSDITNYPFIQLISEFKKPIILSTGASSLEEINSALSWIELSKEKIALLHCILNYPTEDRNANLAMILDLKKQFPDLILGYSDHTLPRDMKNLEIATLLGAKIIEKHFTHDKSLPGNDHYHAMDLEDLKILRNNLDSLFTVLGSFKKEPLESERLSRLNARRSLVAKESIKKGETIKQYQLTWKRPASGISPARIKEVIGKELAKDIEEDQILQWDLFK